MQKDMGITHDDFYRLLPNAVGDRRCQRLSNGVLIEDGEQQIRIVLGPELIRQIAMIRLPHTLVDLQFSGMDAEQIATFIKRFDLAFRRGGG